MSLETNVETARPIQQIVGRMTVSELGDSIRTVLETGRLGTPVNVRLHWEFSESANLLHTVLTTAVAIADVALQLEEPAWRGRQHEAGRTLNLLGSDRRGRTLMITLVAESMPQTALTIFGNHGIVRLDEGWVDPNSIGEPVKELSWIAAIQAAFGE
ncbi:MAG: hypothetical protein ACI8P0_004365 [Planctomycetaceae bacterium]|jgi:hypothetical protein